jgi:hypothetical protein
MARTPRRLVDTIKMISGQEPLPANLPPARRALFERVRELVMSPAIVGVGVSKKLAGEEDLGELGIVFYVREKLKGGDLDPALLIPPVILDPRGRAVLTDVRAVGEVTAQANIAASPIRSGFSVGHEGGTTGTIGAIVQVGGKPHILSAAHVLADYGLGSVGDRIFYPARPDGGTVPDSAIATLTSFNALLPGAGYSNAADAALARIAADRVDDIDYAIPGAKRPLQVAVPYEGMRVTLTGRSAGAGAVSTVRDLHATVEPYYSGVGFVGFKDQVECPSYTSDGDSGALVIAADTGEIVGLHIAGSPTSSYFTPFAAVRKAVAFTL